MCIVEISINKGVPLAVPGRGDDCKSLETVISGEGMD